ncbi:hypothetical protein GCK72_007570 [Caenorhabditis remanei]|uniref:BTB domain-containing protein n=1 Tax=Caenorhabditis remanei TaxID=31234 RepID=A0A6A5HKG1_CAERE|nr:hypothetical protein GCK72_007570 [Caenorhabditis remanei]KAF1767611.1 hypothetical protein GCK72_007570 [Caenorhabditis remanei]
MSEGAPPSKRQCSVLLRRETEETSPRKNILEFVGSDTNLHDVVLLVQNRKFYVNKKQLAVHSKFFHRMFFGGFEETEKDEIEIKDLDASQFHNFLEAVYGVLYVDDSIVEGLIELADRLDCEHILKKCKDHLMEMKNGPSNKLLRMAIRYDMKPLKTKILSSIKTKRDLRDLIRPTTDGFDHETMNFLLEKSLGMEQGPLFFEDGFPGSSTNESARTVSRWLAMRDTD